MKKTVFDCQMCGQCCEGEGGIVLSPKDLKRLYEGLNLEKQAFLDAYGVFRNGKWQVRTGEDGNCIFFRAGQSCTVHAIKPDVCRAWPFFRGNIALRRWLSPVLPNIYFFNVYYYRGKMSLCQLNFRFFA